jgi:hypothetical protein
VIGSLGRWVTVVALAQATVYPAGDRARADEPPVVGYPAAVRVESGKPPTN